MSVVPPQLCRYCGGPGVPMEPWSYCSSCTYEQARRFLAENSAQLDLLAVVIGKMLDSGVQPVDIRATVAAHTADQSENSAMTRATLFDLAQRPQHDAAVALLEELVKDHDGFCDIGSEVSQKLMAWGRARGLTQSFGVGEQTA